MKTSAHPVEYKSVWECIAYTKRNEGIRGFYKGLMPTLFKVAPAASISYLTYENMRKLL